MPNRSLKGKLGILIGKRCHFNIHVLNSFESLDFILKNNCSVARFGDGEFDLIRGKSIPYQTYSSDLAKKLKEIINNGSNDKILICLPDVFIKLNRYLQEVQQFYYQFFAKNYLFVKEIESTKNIYGSTFISRPYIDLKDKSQSGVYFEKLKKIWKDKDVLIVEGKYSRSGEGNDLFANAKSISRIICPSKDAYRSISIIEENIIKYSENKLILLMLGPTSKVIVYDLYEKISNQILDMGHIDSEYEWMKLKADKKIKLNNKHTAEFNYDDNKIILPRNKSFEKEVVCVIE